MEDAGGDRIPGGVRDIAEIPITSEEVIYFMDKLGPKSRRLVMLSEEGAIYTYNLTLGSWKKLSEIQSSLLHINYFIGHQGRLVAQKRNIRDMPFVELWGNNFRRTGVAVESLNTLVNNDNPNFIALLSSKELQGDQNHNLDFHLKQVTEVSIRTLTTKKVVRRYFIGFSGFFYCPAFKGDFVTAVDARNLTVIDIRNHLIYQTSFHFDYENSEIVQIQVQRKGPGVWWVILYLNIRDQGIQATIIVCKPELASKNTRFTTDRPKGETLCHSTQVVFDCRPHNMQTFSENFGLIFWTRPHEVVLVGDEQVYFFDVLPEPTKDVPVWRLRHTLPDVDLTSIVDMGWEGYFFTSWNKLQAF